MSDGQDIIGELLPPERLMLTPGPSCVDPRVYRAMAAPLVGHMDPWFTGMMDDVQVLLRQVFRTQNRITFPISASGSGGIEAAVMNPLETGDECIVCVNGAFSERMAIIAERIPAKVTAWRRLTVAPSIRRTFFAPARAGKSNLSASRTAKPPPASFSGSRTIAK